jgi:SH3-like domain-containing protein
MALRLLSSLLSVILLAAAPALAQQSNPHPPVEPGHPTHHPHHVPVVPAKGPTHPEKPPQKPPTHPAAVSAPLPPATPPAQPAVEQHPAPPPKGSSTGLPLPRFAALRSDDVNLRVGPGTRYPIDWVYKRRGLPVEIEREFDVWRLVMVPDGTKGWVHQATLTGHRSVVVTGANRTLRHEPRDDSEPVAILKPGVIAHLRSCQADSAWCQLQVGDYRGWLKRDEFWGTLPGETVGG